MSNFIRAEGGGGHGDAKGDAKGGSATPKVDKAARAAVRNTGMTYLWYVITGVMFGLMVAYAYRLTKALIVKRRAIAARKAGTTSTKTASAISRFCSAVSTGYSNMAYVSVIPLSIYAKSTPAEWVWCIIYLGITLGVGFHASIFQGKMDFNNVMGMVSFAQMPLIVGLASRNNVLSMLTGISYEKLNFLHRAAGRVCVLTAMLHIFGWCRTGLGKHGVGSWNFTTGMIA